MTGTSIEAAPSSTAQEPAPIVFPPPPANPGFGEFEDIRERTNDALPPTVARRARTRARTLRVDAATVIALAVTQAHADGVLPRLVEVYRARGSVTTMFGSHAPKRQARRSTPIRLNYNPTRAEARGYQALAEQLGISRTVLVSLSLAHYLGMNDPASLV